MVDLTSSFRPSMLVTHEIASTFISICRAAITSGTVDIPTRSAQLSAENVFPRRFISWPQHGCVHAFADRNSEPLSRFNRHPAIVPRISFADIDKPQPQVRIFLSHQQICPCVLMWSLIATSRPCPYSWLMPPAAFVRIARALHARKSSHRKHHAAHRISFIQVHASLHHHHGHSPILPITNWPACPMAVESAKCGMSL